MSDWLVDTNALLWFLEDSPRLSAKAKVTMEAPQSTLIVSSASVWEIGIKSALGKLTIDGDLSAILQAERFIELPVRHSDGWLVRELPVTAHKDPFDRLIAAQAIAHQLPVISSDAALDQYGVTRHW